MRFASTRGASPPAALSEALERGLAPDGGLYVPEAFPTLGPDDRDAPRGLPAVGSRLLAPFFADDPLAPALEAICGEAFSFPIPLVQLGEGTAVLELFHGPTAAFKDVGARFLAACLQRLVGEGDQPLTVLVATSGDTGGAVAAACAGRPGLEVIVLYPAGKVSPRQEKQLTTWGGNVTALAVRGTFDDCQRLAKQALADPEVRARRRLSSANSINIGRLLPQMVYYAWAALAYARAHGAAPGFIVPTGNLGNAVAALWARQTGMPITEVVLATNENRTIPEFLASGAWRPQPTRQTLATAMDVSDPSNMERVFHLFGGPGAARARLRAFAVSDEAIREEIRRGEDAWGRIWDPHTATAVRVRRQVEGDHWIVVATAHPAKFPETVEPLVGRQVPVPPALAEVLERQGSAVAIEADYEALREALRHG